MARAVTEAIWLSSEYGPALFQFIEQKASRRKRLLISAEMLTRLTEPIPAADRPTSSEIVAVQSLILQEAAGAIPSAFMVVNDHVRVDKFITAAVMGQADLLTRLIAENEGYRSPAELVNLRPRDPEYEVLRWGLFRYFADVVRDVIGNPFRSRSFPRSWRTSDTLGLARGIYEEQSFDRLPIMSDALMDAGCDNERIIAHCRNGGTHFHGCWVVDLVLGKP
jgi:hypothetical protein